MSIEIVGAKLPIIKEGNDLVSVIKEEVDFRKKDILVISETVVSRSKGRVKELKEVKVSEKAKKLSKKSKKDKKICQLIINECDEIIAVEENFIITEINGLVCANAGIDLSNAGKGKAILPIRDPKKVAEKLFEKLKAPIIISDSVGRPFRKGTVGLAIGYAGLKPFSSCVGIKDLFGREMETTTECIADELASAANLVFGESDKGIPVAVIKGFNYDGEPKGETINRRKDESIFR